MKISLQSSNPRQTVDLPDEGRTNVLEIKNPGSWHVVYCDLNEYKQQYITIKFTADIKRTGAAGNLIWQINNKGYPTVGNSIKKAAMNNWHKMFGEWTGTLTDSSPVLYLNTWKNNSESTTYYIDNFNVEVVVNPEVRKVVATQKPLSDMAKYMQGLLPSDIPGEYSLNPMLKSISKEESIRNGVLAFRDFMYQLCDRLIADGSKYEKPTKETEDKSASHPSFASGYPFIHHVKSVLINIGYHSELAENGDSMLLGDFQSLNSVISSSGGQSASKISGPKLIDSLRFLNSCGLYFEGIDLDASKPDISNVKLLEITYPDNPVMLTGLKVMATAQRELRLPDNDDIFLRCDYRALKNEDSDITDILRDFIRPLPEKTQGFALKLHQRFLDTGLSFTAKSSVSLILITYWYKKNAVCEFAASLSSGYRIFIKAKNISKYVEIIENFSLPLREIVYKGYGCEKKRFGEPCQKGCHGYSIPLDDSILDISRDIEIWLDNELLCLQKKRSE